MRFARSHVLSVGLRRETRRCGFDTSRKRGASSSHHSSVCWRSATPGTVRSSWGLLATAEASSHEAAFPLIFFFSETVLPCQSFRRFGNFLHAQVVHVSCVRLLLVFFFSLFLGCPGEEERVVGWLTITITCLIRRRGSCLEGTRLGRRKTKRGKGDGDGEVD